jgi:mevalonate kinase
LFSSRNRAIGKAHSKLILIGEHAVVYGHPAIALPFPTLTVTCAIEEADSGIHLDSKLYSGPIDQIPKRLKGLAICIHKTLQEIGKHHNGLLLKIESMIPIGRGLGSSAAIAVAIVRSLFQYFNCELSDEKLRELVNIAETYAHGNPSGIDMESVCCDEPIWFERGKGIASVAIRSSFYLVVADTGRAGDTRSAVGSIKHKLDKSPIQTKQSIDRIGQYTLDARNALIQGNLVQLGLLLNLAQTELEKLGVSDHGINHLVNIARNAGALGAKLTGGGRGGCIIALAENCVQAREISEQLNQNGAKRTWSFKVEETQQIQSITS